MAPRYTLLRRCLGYFCLQYRVQVFFFFSISMIVRLGVRNPMWHFFIRIHAAGVVVFTVSTWVLTIRHSTPLALGHRCVTWTAVKFASAASTRQEIVGTLTGTPPCDWKGRVCDTRSLVCRHFPWVYRVYVVGHLRGSTHLFSPDLPVLLISPP